MITEDRDIADLVLEDAAKRTGTVSYLMNPIPTTWADSALGLPEPGYMYLQVITPGLMLTVQAGDKELIYHADTHVTFKLVEG